MKIVLLLSLLAAKISSLKVGIISDVHLIKYYNDKASQDEFCEEWSANKTLV